MSFELGGRLSAAQQIAAAVRQMRHAFSNAKGVTHLPAAELKRYTARIPRNLELHA